MAVAIIGGTITSTLLTLLVIPSFYDSIEIARDRALAKFQRRAQRWHVAPAFVVTLLEAFATLLLLRLLWRGLLGLVRWAARRINSRRALPA
jgi:HAE1 family hydrophobic/amphiphilic exporter-1